MRLSTDEFIKKAKKKHGNTYDYSRVKYIDCLTEVEIGCPVHGFFSQKPVTHTAGVTGHGCRKCANERISQSRIKHDTDETLRQEVEKAVKFCGGKFPTVKETHKYGLYDFIRVVNKFGGRKKVREILGYLPFKNKNGIIPKDSGHWNDTANIKAYFIKNFPVLYERGLCPSSQLMYAVEYPSFLSKVGGIQGVCILLNLQPVAGYLTRDGHLVKSFYELLLDEYLYSRGIQHKPEVRPFKRKKYRCDQKVGDTYIEIWGLIGSQYDSNYEDKKRRKKKLYKHYNFDLLEFTPSFFDKSFEVMEKELDKIFSSKGYDVTPKIEYSMESIAKHVDYPWNELIIREKLDQFIKNKNNGRFPKKHELEQAGETELVMRIYEFGGLFYFCNLMGHVTHRKPAKYWTLEHIIEELKLLSEKLGYFPKNKDLSSSLRNAIRHFPHDLNYYRELLGCKITKKSNGYWTTENIKKELLDVINSIKTFPSNNQLIKMGKRALSIAIQRSGGFIYWKQQLGYLTNPPNLLN